jgi:hypothetical protein
MLLLLNLHQATPESGFGPMTTIEGSGHLGSQALPSKDTSPKHLK